MRKPALALLVLLLACGLAAGQDNNPPATDDIDSLFTEDPADAEDDTAQGEPDVLSDIFTKGITAGADFRLLAGYSPGLKFPGEDPEEPALAGVTYSDLALLDMSASISLDVRFAPELRVFGKFSAVLPQFRAEISELFCDFSIVNAVFLRIGRQTLSWNISPNYPFADVLARMPTGTNDEAADSIACKITVPIGVGGIDLLAFSRTSLWAAPDQPTMDEIGAGLRFNLALQNFDFSVGGYYHKDLLLRFFYTLKTTLFDTVEAYTEGVAATNLLAVSDPAVSSWYFSANAGVYFDLFAEALRVNAEYFFCGEQSELEVKGAMFTLLPGHNLALNASLSLCGGQFKIFFQGKYNISENSGILIPAATLDVIPHVTFSLAIPVVVGPASGGYFTQNTDNNLRRACIVLAVVLGGKI